MRTSAALKNEFVDHPAPQPPVQIFLQYTRTVQTSDMGIDWKSRPNALSDIVFKNYWRPLPARQSEIEAIVRAQVSLKKGLEHLLAEEKRIKEMAATQPIPGHYVDVASVAISVSMIVLVVCALSLTLGYLSGFNALHPSVALLTAAAGVVFLVMGFMMSKDRRSNAT